MARSARSCAAVSPDRDRRQALGEHVEWMLDHLHGHQRGEYDGLRLLVRSRNPAAAALRAAEPSR